MANKYGIFQNSTRSCVFYKEDEDGNQSTFNIFVTPKKDNIDRKQIMAFIDNEQMKTENWFKEDVTQVEDIVEAFGGWATDAPMMFEIEAQKSMSQCLSAALKKKDKD